MTAACATPIRSAQTRGDQDFRAALDRQMRLHGDDAASLARALRAKGAAVGAPTLRKWRRGAALPYRRDSRAALLAIAARYGLSGDYFLRLLPISGRRREVMAALAGPRARRRRLVEALPSAYPTLCPEGQAAARDGAERDVSRATAFRPYQAAATRTPFALRFPELEAILHDPAAPLFDDDGPLCAPLALRRELAGLVAFKRAMLTPPDLERQGRWGVETARQRTRQLLLVFGALHAAPDGPVGGAGAPKEPLRLALLAAPHVLAWALGWRSRRRGFLTVAEAGFLELVQGLTHPERGWLTQTPSLARGLQVVPGILSARAVAELTADWPRACAAARSFAISRQREVARAARQHRDPFEPILPILEAPDPVAEYRKIALAVLRRRSGASGVRQHDEALRDHLMLRLGLHLGFRARNLRELLVAPRGMPWRSEAELDTMRRGELRWRGSVARWEVFAPARAFKNAGSSFFEGRPFQAALPDLDGLYGHLEAYLAGPRTRLLGRARDTGEILVRPPRCAGGPAAYSKAGFYEAWRRVIERCATGREAALAGLAPDILPHGPQAVRDVLATHVLKKTGSFEHAAFAIQDTPDTVRRHYARFHPRHKAALAAEVLDRVWAAASAGGLE